MADKICFVNVEAIGFPNGCEGGIAEGNCLVGGVFYFFGDKKQAEILPVAKYEVQLPGSRAVLILPDGRKVDLENEVLRSDLAQSDSLLLISTISLKY